MKSTHQDRGSTHIVLIIILVVAVLGLLGVVFWQNFVNQPAEQTGTSQSVTDESTDSSTPDPTDSFDTPLTVEEWGVVGDLGDISALGSVSYAISQLDGGGAYLRFLTDEVDCGLGNGHGQITRLTAEEASDAISSTGVQVGEYYYFYRTGNGVCGQDGNPHTEVVQVLRAASERFVETLVEKE